MKIAPMLGSIGVLNVVPKELECIFLLLPSNHHHPCLVLRKKTFLQFEMYTEGVLLGNHTISFNFWETFDRVPQFHKDPTQVYPFQNPLFFLFIIFLVKVVVLVFEGFRRLSSFIVDIEWRKTPVSRTPEFRIYGQQNNNKKSSSFLFWNLACLSDFSFISDILRLRVVFLTLFQRHKAPCVC